MLGAKVHLHAWSSMRPAASPRPRSQFLPITREEKRRCSSRTHAVDRSMDEQVPSAASSVSSEERRHDGPAGPTSSNWRWILALSTIAILICYADRTNISVAIVPMSQELGWSEQYKGTVLSVFFIGYAATQMLGGTLADEYGGKRVMAAGVVLWSLFTFLTPVSAAMGTVFLMSCRIAMGLGEGVAFPAVHAVISATVPRARQSTAVAIVTAASYTGTTIASGLSPMIISNVSWQAVFYVFGASATLWLPFWFAATIPQQKAPETAALPVLETEESPAPARVPTALEDMSASSQVLDMPNADTDQLIDRRQGAASSEIAAGSRAFELGRVLESMGMDSGFIALTKRKEVWAICAAQYCNSWGAYALLNWLPTYFSEQYNVGLDQLGEYTVLPPLAQVITGSISGVLADYLIQQGYSVKAVRRYLQVVGMLGPALCLLAVSSPTTGSSAASASVLITVALGLNALTLGAVSVSQLDIAPRHAGSIFGLGNTFATLAGFLSTRLTGDILQITGSWAAVFSLTAVHFIAGSVVWWLWVGDSQLPEDKLA